MVKQKKEQEEKKNHKKIFFILLCLLLLLLITSCNANLFGKIGSIFDGSSSYEIEDKTKDFEQEKNTSLRFIKKKGETSVDDSYKVEYISSLNTKKYQCTTSDAEIATCKVKGNYVEVSPKKKGKVTISIIAKVNGKKYIGTHLLTILGSNKSISLASDSGKINLHYENSLSIYYQLNHIDGKVVVTSSNNEVATATAKNGVLTIKAYKAGKTTITLTVTYQGKKYQATYRLTVTGSSSGYHKKPSPSNNASTNSSSSSNASTGNSSHPEEPKNEKSDISTLENIRVIGFETTKEGSSSTKYQSKVNFDTSSVAVDFIKTSPNATIHATISNQNGMNQEITDFSNIFLTEGNNTITIKVSSESGKSTTQYTLTIQKPKRTIELSKDITEIKMEAKTTDVLYQIMEDGNVTTDYDKNSIKASTTPNFRGDILIKEGKIAITPTVEDIGKIFTLTVEYLGKTSSMDFTVTMKNYYASLNANQYEFNYLDDEINPYLIINTNLFSSDSLITKTTIPGGIRLSNEIGYLDIVSSSPDLLSFLYQQEDNENPTSSLAILTNLKGEGEVMITISGSAYQKDITKVQGKVIVTSKYRVTIDAQDGFFNSFTSKYQLLLNKGEILKLSDYVAYLVDDPKKCTYFELDSYHTKSDGTGTRYGLEEEIEVHENLSLYAIYKEEEGSKYIDLPDTGVMYLTEVDLFHNEEYYKKYKKDKIIYPGANGSHTMYIENHSAKKIEIDSITLTEDTMCTPSGCINMGYILRYYVPTDSTKETKYHYFYGSNDNYQILNQDSSVIKNHHDGLFLNTITANHDVSSPIELDPMKKDKNRVEIDLLWKWVDTDSQADTEIGKIKKDTDYTITVRIDYHTIDKCSK